MKISIFTSGWKKLSKRTNEHKTLCCIHMAYVRGKLPPALAVILLMSVATYSMAQDSEIPEPDLALLEFLGSFETDNGEWIAPDSLLDSNFQQLLNMAARMDEVSGNAGNTGTELEIDDESGDEQKPDEQQDTGNL